MERLRSLLRHRFARALFVVILLAASVSIIAVAMDRQMQIDSMSGLPGGCVLPEGGIQDGVSCSKGPNFYGPQIDQTTMLSYLSWVGAIMALVIIAIRLKKPQWPVRRFISVPITLILSIVLLWIGSFAIEFWGFSINGCFYAFWGTTDLSQCASGAPVTPTILDWAFAHSAGLDALYLPLDLLVIGVIVTLFILRRKHWSLRPLLRRLIPSWRSLGRRIQELVIGLLGLYLVLGVGAIILNQGIAHIGSGNPSSHLVLVYNFYQLLFPIGDNVVYISVDLWLAAIFMYLLAKRLPRSFARPFSAKQRLWSWVFAGVVTVGLILSGIYFGLLSRAYNCGDGGVLLSAPDCTLVPTPDEITSGFLNNVGWAAVIILLVTLLLLVHRQSKLKSGINSAD